MSKVVGLFFNSSSILKKTEILLLNDTDGRRECDRGTSRETFSHVQKMCVNIKALVSEINQITLKSCYKKSFNQKIYIFFVVLIVFFLFSRVCAHCECGQWREFDKLCHIHILYFFLFGCGISFALRSSVSSH